MIDLKEWLEFKLATAEKITKEDVQTWMQQFSDIENTKVTVFKNVKAFEDWKNKSDYEPLHDVNIGKYAEAVQEEVNKVLDKTPAYKVGDKVEVVDRTSRHGFELGEIVTIKSFCGQESIHDVICDGDHDYWWLNFHEIKPYTPEDDLIQQQKECEKSNYIEDQKRWLGNRLEGKAITNSEKFKVGDEIKYKHSGQHTVRAVTISLSNKQGTPMIWFDDDNKGFLYEDDPDLIKLQ